MPRVKTVGRAKWRSAQTEYLSKADDQSQIGYPPFALEEISQPLCLLMAEINHGHNLENLYHNRKFRDMPRLFEAAVPHLGVSQQHGALQHPRASVVLRS